MKKERRLLEEKVSSLEAETEGLRLEVRNMRSHPFPYEKAARERLGYGRPGEVVYDFRTDPLESPR